MMAVDSIRARAARLEQLNLGLAKEAALWKSLDSPLLRAEQQAYLTAIRDGIAALDAAWHTLTTAVRRIEDDAAASFVRRDHGTFIASAEKNQR
jgi:hypothetical protein